MSFSVNNPGASITDGLMLKLQEIQAKAEQAEAENEALYTDYYDRACNGETDDIPTDALQNMATDPDCSPEAFKKIAAELEKRGEPVDREAAARQANDELYSGYYDKACDGDVSDIPTNALQNMAMDPECSTEAYDFIAAELKARGEPVQRVEDNEAMYTRYYEMACNNDVAFIPTEALQNMAMDPNCSSLAFDNIAEELDWREEPLDPSAYSNDPYQMNTFLD